MEQKLKLNMSDKKYETGMERCATEENKLKVQNKN